MKKITLVAALLGSAVMASPAMAAPLLYNFISTVADRPSFSFNVDSNPVATDVSGSRFDTLVQNYNQNVSSPSRSIRFYTTVELGGFDNSFSYFGPQLFSGTTASPTLLTGNFTLFTNAGMTNVAGNLSVTDLTAAVPEPATWAMMLVGFGMIGATARYRRRATKIAYA